MASTGARGTLVAADDAEIVAAGGGGFSRVVVAPDSGVAAA